MTTPLDPAPAVSIGPATAAGPRRLLLFSAPDGVIDRGERGEWMAQPFAAPLAAGPRRLLLFSAPDGVIDRGERGEWMTPPFAVLLNGPAARPSPGMSKRYVFRPPNRR